MAAGESIGMARLKSILGFFIGIFGAMAILGVFFKIAKLPNYELFMQIGFIGEAAAFVIMGLFELMNAFLIKSPKKDAVETEADGGMMVATMGDINTPFSSIVEQRLGNELDVMMLALAKEVKTFSDEMRELGGALGDARSSVVTMRNELDRVSSGDLAADAQRLGEGMRTLGGEMAGAGSTVESIRSDLETMAARFRQFNMPIMNGGGK